jgi:hypothetical protein
MVTHPLKAISAARRAFRNRTARSNPAPVFVLGNQKSGTTAIAALFAEATGKSITHDFLFHLPEEELRGLLFSPATLPTFVRAHRVPFSRAIIKDNSLTFLRSELMELFPAARFFFILRDPRDNIRSILNRLRIPGDLPILGEGDRAEADSNPLWSWLVDGVWPAVSGRNHIEKMARRWNRALDVYQNDPQGVPILRYEDFCEDKVGTIGKLAQSMGFAVVHEIGGLAGRQFQPAGDNSMSWRAFFGEDNLSSIEEICADGMSRFGYKFAS